MVAGDASRPQGRLLRHRACGSAPILLRANAESKKPDFNKYITLKDIYKDIERWKEAADAAQLRRSSGPTTWTWRTS